MPIIFGNFVSDISSLKIYKKAVYFIGSINSRVIRKGCYCQQTAAVYTKKTKIDYRFFLIGEGKNLWSHSHRRPIDENFIAFAS
jgi:hypothetical protein